MQRMWLAALLVLVLGANVTAEAADAARGRVLYETRCTGCHETSVHGRAKRTADSCMAVRNQVARWNQYTGGTWSADEVDDVALWLNERYYRFPVENGRCATPIAAFTPARKR
jgi:mono/diheme cytochrome c family protein